MENFDSFELPVAVILSSRMKQFFLLLILTLPLVPVFAQEREAKPPLSLKISFVKLLKAKGSFMLRAELLNTSNENVVIDKNSLYYGLNFRSPQSVSGTSGEIGAGSEGNYLILAPQESYAENQTIKLPGSGEDFFENDRRYEMRRVYGQFTEKAYQGLKVWRGAVESNPLTFQLRKGRLIINRVKARRKKIFSKAS